MDAKYELVTPKMAEKWLNSNVCNRSLRPGVVEKYADDMRTGRWTNCNVPISFYDSGEVADGQHRLYAIIESGEPQKFIVAHGFRKIDGLNFDTNLIRTLVDNAKIAGVHSTLSHNLIANCRAIEEGRRQMFQYTSNSRKMDNVKRHEEAARWAMNAMGIKRGLSNAISIGSVGRAWYHETDKDRLAKFCKCYTTGFVEDGVKDSAAIAIRNYVLETGSGPLMTGPGWVDTWRKMQNAIYYFMRGKSLKVIKKVMNETYPLPHRKGNSADISR